jgi:hypothetical protein
MKKSTRREVIAARVSGLAVAARLANRYGLIPPAHGGVYTPGEILTYALHLQTLVTRWVTAVRPACECPVN